MPSSGSNISPGQYRAKSKSKGNENSERYVHPVEGASGFDGSVADHMARAFGNWQSDNAVDISCTNGTKILAVEDGIIGEVNLDESYDPGANPNGDSVYLNGETGTYWYTHMKGVVVDTNQQIKQGDVIGLSGSANGVPHLHFAAEPPLNPENVVTNSETQRGGTLPAGQFNVDDIFGIGKAAAYAAQVSLPGLLNSIDSIYMRGKKSVYNDEPLLPFIQQLCQGSLRRFQSLPDGSFFAFFPDYFGSYDHQKPYWEIREIEIMDGGMQLNDEALATTVFTPGDTMNFSSAIESPERFQSTGVITIFEMFLTGNVGTEKQKDLGKEEGRVTEAVDFLRKYGQRPYYEEAPFIRNKIFETFYAFTQFQLFWSRQFITEFSFTFMPELYPGGIVAFPDYGFQCYIESVNHMFDYQGGFQTQATLIAPAAYGDGNEGYSKGMIRRVD